ncbi:hypothetical protein NUH88_13285 [Nisaea acidiphila]|uniref:Tetratricopeptide repeat protein n=1 Tax=Nisaea acidiphila TaxID=1862145 RepID=A0A9J7AN57_9PROT|nr:hypothetical protein [Nisaea acidiphila]UUX48386.1 hypothetical protein NUH88_13285 [Nisaea acidiphila]
MSEPRRHDSEVIAAQVTGKLVNRDLSATDTETYRRWNAILFPEQAERWAALAQSLPDLAELLLVRAIMLSPGDFRFHFNLSNRLLSAGRQKEARQCLDRVMLLSPSFSASYGNRAAISPDACRRLQLQGRAWVCGGGLENGVSASERLIAAERYGSADEILSDVLAQSPLFSFAWRQKAILQHRRRNLRGARLDHCRAIISNPALSDSYLAAYVHFCDCRSFEAAGRMLDFAERITPAGLAIQVNRGSMLEAMGRPAEALWFARRSVLREPGIADINYNVGTVYGSLGKVDEALKFQERVSIIAPHMLGLKNNLAQALLKSGQYRRGFEAYEYRWYAESMEQPSIRTLHPHPSFDLPLWDGGQTQGSNILLWGEQGLGDEIWALGCLAMLEGRAERFDIEIDRRLVPLAQSAFPHFTFVARDVDSPFDCTKYDAQLPLQSLPHCLGRPDRPVEPGWGRPNAERLAEVRAKMTRERDVRVVGLGWRSVKPVSRWSFDLTLKCLAGLGALEDVLFMPVQYGMSEEDWASVSEMFGSERVLRPDFDVWYDIPALNDAVASMDAVVTAATMLVPLTISAGTPAVAVLNETQRDWRYLPGKKASPMLPGVLQLWPTDCGRQQDIAEALSTVLRSKRRFPIV